MVRNTLRKMNLAGPWEPLCRVRNLNCTLIVSTAIYFFFQLRLAQVMRQQWSGRDALNAAFQGHTLSAITPRVRVIAVGCNRPEGLLQSLNAIRDARIVGEVSLHICVDGCQNLEVEHLAQSYRWPHGPKSFTIRKERFGLASHIAACWENPQSEEWALFIEDDVVVAPHAFTAFHEALAIRSLHNFADNIVGIALHDTRVNQYCWKKQIQDQSCPRIQTECVTHNTTYSTLGSLMCMHDERHGSWMLHQVPSSWGAFYEGKAWSTFQDYFRLRAHLSVGESLVVSVPHSISNEWSESWKRFYLELMFSAGWTMMYRSHPTQVGYASTMRSTGVHTRKYEELLTEKQCLVNLPLDNSSVYTRDNTLGINSNQMKSYDYCIGETPMEDLSRQGLAFTKHLAQHYVGDKDAGSAALAHCVRILRQASQDKTQAYQDLPGVLNPDILSSGYNVSFWSRAEIIIVTSTGSMNRDFIEAVQQYEKFGGLIRFIVVAPPLICRKMLRGNIFADCLDESHFESEENGLPVLKKMLQAGADAAMPGVTKWVGYVNGDIIFDQSLIQTLGKVSESEVCHQNSIASCVVVGQRVDRDWDTGDEKLHSEWGMDYFIFNRPGLEFTLQDGLVAPFTVGRVRWDSWLMGFFVSSNDMNVIDASKSMRVLHFMNFEEAYASKTIRDRTNLKLADKKFRLGRTDYANYRTDPKSNHSLVPLMPANASKEILRKNQFRWDLDEQLEKATNFTYTSAALPAPYVGCFCDLLQEMLSSTKVVVSEVFSHCEEPSEYLAESRRETAKRRILFHKEVFELMASGFAEWNNGTKQPLDNLPEAKPDSMSRCCVLSSASLAPVTVPGRFWTMDTGGPARCIMRKPYVPIEQ